jgi:hypothetical protein
MKNSKTLKIQNAYIEDLEFQNFKNVLSHINGVLCTWFIEKSCNLYYIKLNFLKINIFWYDFKLSSFFKMKYRIYKEYVHFYKFILFQKN